MAPFSRRIAALVASLFLALAAGAHAEDVAAAAASDAPPALADPGALAEAYFDESERFDAFLTYEVRRGPARAVFTVARRWRDGEAELLFDIREPAAFDKWAMLLRETRGGSDDLFLYGGIATDGKVRRLASAMLERQAIFELFSPGDYRPTPRGELQYEAAPDTLLDTVPCHVLRARSRAYLGFDALELVFAADTGLLLESRYLRGGREVRRLSTTPADYREVEGHRLPFHRVARRWGDDGETEIVLLHAVETPDLPDGLFSDLNLRVQRFPEF